jgi:hypothetical protein
MNYTHVYNIAARDSNVALRVRKFETYEKVIYPVQNDTKFLFLGHLE